MSPRCLKKPKANDRNNWLISFFVVVVVVGKNTNDLRLFYSTYIQCIRCHAHGQLAERVMHKPHKLVSKSSFDLMCVI